MKLAVTGGGAWREAISLARAVDGAGEALHQKFMLGKRSAPRGVHLDEQGPCQSRLTGAELEQLRQARPQPLAPGRLPLGDAGEAAVDPLGGVMVSLGEAVVLVLEMLVEGGSARPSRLDHVLHGDLLVAPFATDDQGRLQQALASGAGTAGRVEDLIWHRSNGH
jgi:hypothetical protein